MANRLLNYTTKVEAEYSQQEIRSMLRHAGASNITESIDRETKKTTGFSFHITTPGGEGVFQLPARIAEAYAVMERQGTLPYKPKYRASSVARAAEAKRAEGLNKAQAERVAWRILRDWLEAQLALTLVGMVQLEEIFLPYLLVEEGKTVYQMGREEGLFKLPAPKADA